MFRTAHNAHVWLFMQLLILPSIGHANSLTQSQTGAVGPSSVLACACPFQGDFDADGGIDINDFVAMQNLMIGGGADAQDPDCPASRADYNADGFVDVVDLYEILEEYLGSNNPPAEPCVCGYPCELPHALGEAHVRVESKSIDLNVTDTIGIYVSNTTNIYGLVVPLAVRAITAYPSAISARFVPEGRVDWWMMGTTVLAYDLENGACGGFGSPDSVGPSSPDAFVFLNTLDSRLPPGDDGDTASMEIIVTMPDSGGAFEIDTTCADPGHYFVFFEGSQYATLYPTFERGIVTVGTCDCPHQGDMNADGLLNVVDMNAAIGVYFYNAPDPQDPQCPSARSDFNADGVSDAVDLNGLIDAILFNGPGPVDPCA